MPEDIKLLIRKAKLKLFTKELIFFGICSNKFTWEVEEFDPNIEGYVKFEEKIYPNWNSARSLLINIFYLNQIIHTIT